MYAKIYENGLLSHLPHGITISCDDTSTLPVWRTGKAKGNLMVKSDGTLIIAKELFDKIALNSLYQGAWCYGSEQIIIKSQNVTLRYIKVKSYTNLLREFIINEFNRQSSRMSLNDLIAGTLTKRFNNWLDQDYLIIDAHEKYIEIDGIITSDSTLMQLAKDHLENGRIVFHNTNRRWYNTYNNIPTIEV